MTTKDREYDINLVDKAAMGFERIDSGLEGSSVGEMQSRSITCYRELVLERRLHPCSTLHRFKNPPQPPPLSAAATQIRQPLSTSTEGPPPAKGYGSLRAQMTASISEQYFFLIKACALFYRHNVIAHSRGFSIVWT